jgi:transposase-like protein
MRKPTSFQEAIEQGASWTAEDARAALAACAQSGESTVEFARRHGISVQRLYWWRHRLKAAEPSATTQAVAPLIPVTMRPAALRSDAVLLITDGELRIEIAGANAVSPSWVATLLRLVREGCA